MGYYRVQLYCPCMVDACMACMVSGTLLQRTWDRQEMILVDDPTVLIATHNCTKGNI